MAEINENLLRLTGTVVLPETLEIDEDYTLGLTCNIQKREQRSCNNGKYDLVHTGKLNGQVVIQNKWGKNISAKTKGSPSQRLRNRMRIDFEGDDFDGEYSHCMDILISNWGYFREKIKQLDENV